jgi:hypothetical protein
MRGYPTNFSLRVSSRIMMVLGCLTIALAPTQVNSQQAQPKNTYPPALVEDFVKTCSSEGGKEVPPAAMRQICACGIDEIQSQYTLEEFQKVDADLGAGKPLPTEMSDIISGCVQKTVSSQK